MTTSIAAVALCSSALAGSATWLSSPATADWNTATNWNPATIPNGASDTATFRPSSKTAIGISANTQVNGVTFNSNASAYTITIQSNFTLTISGSGINNAAAAEETFVTGTDINHNPATIVFANNASVFAASVTVINDGGRTNFTNSSNATSSTFINKGSAIANIMGGQTNFFDHASANAGQFFNDGGTVPLAGGGKITFSDTSTASFGYFTNNGAGSAGEATGGVISFLGSATAFHAMISNSGGTVSDANGGVTEFHGTSTGASSTLQADGGTNGGKPGAIVYYDDSLGSAGGVGLVNGELDISPHNSPGVTMSGLFGLGNVFLGANNLTIGGTNLSFDFEGIFQDGGRSGGIGGSLTKIGTGTVRLTSSGNTYTGPTLVTGGKLLVTNLDGSGTGTGSVTVTNNSVFGGDGRVSGPVTLAPGSSIRGGRGTQVGDGLLLSNNLTLVSGSRIQLALGESGGHSTLSRLGGTWSFANNQTFSFIDVGTGAQAGLYDNIITGLDSDPGTEASWNISNPFYIGTFSYDGAGNIDLNLTTVGGRIFVSDTSSDRISQYNTSGTNQNLNLITGLSHPGGIAISEGKLFVANRDTGVISVHTLSGALVNPSLVNGLSGPSFLALGGGNIYVLNNNGTIGKYTTSGATVSASLISGMPNATGIAVSGNFLLVADFAANTVSKFTTSGDLVSASFITGLNNPEGIAISEGKLFVANGTFGPTPNGPYGVFNLATIGEYDANTGATINAALVTGLSTPNQVAVSKGYLFVLSQSGSHLGEYTPAGATVNATLLNFLNGSFSVAIVQDLVQVTKAVSRKVHGSAGTFDINLPLTGEPGIECRSGPVPGNYTLVFTFSNIVESGSAAVTTGTGSVFGSPSFENDTMSVNLTGVSDIQKLVVTLSNVTDNLSNIMPDTTVTMDVLVGDTSASKTVNATDVSQTKIQSGQSVTGANFREDINVNGTINSTDVSLVKSHSGAGLPAIFRGFP